jgi:DNA-binding transcriptional ArsR family regulator
MDVEVPGAEYTPPEPPPADQIRLADILQALGEPKRLAMVQRLADGDWHSCSVEEWGLDLQKSTVSHHLKALREAGLVEYRMRGRNKDARLRRAVVDERFPGLLAGVLTDEAKSDAERD